MSPLNAFDKLKKNAGQMTGGGAGDDGEDDKKSPDLQFAEMVEHDANRRGDGSILYSWNSRIWAPIEPVELEREAFRFLGVHFPARATTRSAKGCAEAGVINAKPLPKFKSDTLIVLPMQNGYLHIDLESGGLALREHEKKYGLSYQIDCNFNLDAAAPRFDKFLSEILPDEAVRNYVQEYIGYTLLGDCRYQRAIFWLGSGANGKSKLAEICAALHSKTAAMQLDGLEGFRLAGLVGTSLVYVDETPQRIDEQQLKALISGGLVQIDRKFREPISLRPTAKWIISGNALPAISDQSHGFWRRMPVVTFPTRFSDADADPMIAESIIKHELAGVLNWALKGLCRLTQRGRFPETPAAMAQAIESGKLESNSVLGWWSDDRAEFDAEAETPRADVYSDYQAWARRSGMAPVSSPKFWNRLRQILGEDALPEHSVKKLGKKIRVVPLTLLDPVADATAERDFQRMRRDV
ncbi:MAG: phage/plasmid primase, P4 family [Sulfurisoma sp.]|nr:phage/plasmid primase, P4 family [Sulfurisoma sp.]